MFAKSVVACIMHMIAFRYASITHISFKLSGELKFTNSHLELIFFKVVGTNNGKTARRCSTTYIMEFLGLGFECTNIKNILRPQYWCHCTGLTGNTGCNSAGHFKKGHSWTLLFAAVFFISKAHIFISI